MLGVDLGSYALKYFQTKKKREGIFETIGNGELVLPNEVFYDGEIKGKNTLVENIKVFWKKQHLPYDAVVSFYHPRIVVQNISLPAMTDLELENALKWEASSIMTGEENIQIGWQILGKTGNKLDILYAASPSLVVVDYLEVFHKAGIRVAAIEPQIISFLKGFLTLRPDLTKESWFILIDVGFSKSIVVFFEKGKLVYSRYFGWGIRKIWNYLKEKYKLSPAEIQEILNRSTRDNDLPYQLEEALNSTSDSLLSELRRSLAFFKSEYQQVTSDNCFLVGGGSTIIPLRNMLMENLNINFQNIKPIDMGHKKVVPGEVYLSSLGASLWN